MYRLHLLGRYLSLFSLWFLAINSIGQTRPLIWDIEEINTMKANPYGEECRTVFSIANYAIQQAPLSVTQKKISMSGDKHNYESLGCYFWPDPDNPTGPYIAKDGLINPEYKEYDYPTLMEMHKRCINVAKAFYLMPNEMKYYEWFCRQIDAWFINEDTRMYPNFDYCQFCKNKNGNRGNACGLIDSRLLTDINESVRTVNGIRPIGKARLKAYKKWMSDFGIWMTKSENGKMASTFTNNQGIVYDTTLSDIYILNGKMKKARKVLERCGARIEQQIDGEGRQPEELVRSRAYYYSIYNLSHIIDFISLANSINIELPRVTTKAKHATEYLLKFVGNRNSFPYQEIDEWGSLEKMLEKERRRILPEK